MSDLSRLKGADKIRKRVGVMLGSDDIRGCRQTLFEILSNSIDRFKAGHGNIINIIKKSDLTYVIEDFADGLPMAWNEKEKAFNWELATRVLYAGGNYNTTKDSHVGQLGLNGLGLASSVLSSEYAIITSIRDGKKYVVKYKKGRPIDNKTNDYVCEDGEDLFNFELGNRILNSSACVDHTGTTVEYRPDIDVFTDIDIPIEWINEKCKKQAVVNKGLIINVLDEKSNMQYTHTYENGILDYIDDLSNQKSISDTVLFSGDGIGKDREDKEDYKVSYETAFAFNNDTPLIECYHNSSELIHGGSPLEAIKSSFVSIFNNHIKNKGMYNKSESKIKWVDIEDSLLCVISSYSSVTSYSNQTKTSIDNKFIQDFIAESIKDQLNVYLIENDMDATKICNQILINKRSREKANQTRLNIQKKLSEKVTIMNKIPNLIECKSKDTSRNVLCICEGKSSLGSILSGRREVHAILPLRGKILNCLKASPDKILSNDIITNLIQALGCGCTLKSKNKEIVKFNIDLCRYSKVFIVVDQDLDGIGSILPLVLTVFYTLMPDLITDGRLYVCETPKYEVVCSNGDELYAINDNELKEITDKLKIKYDIHYIKGLAELSEKSIAMCLSEGYKNLKQLRMGDVEKSISELELWMGDKVEPRKDYIMNNFNDER